jgi:predicted transcriptional regulator
MNLSAKGLNMFTHMLYHNGVLYMRGTEIEKKIIEYMKAQEWPSTTEDIAKGAGISWNTAELHLVKLQVKNRVKFRKVGRQNQWWLNKSYKDNMNDK